MPNASVSSDIAVIGISCRVAGANSPSELWDLLATSRDVQSEITRFNTKGYYHPHGGPRKGMTNVKDAYMMDDNVIDRFDSAFFHITPTEAIAIDPQQRLLLEISYEAIESAGIRLEDFVGTDTAVYAGIEGTDYHTVLARDIDATPRYLATGTATCMAANRISYFYNLSGPSMAIDTACSSAMVALHQAVRTLQNNEASMAMVCGAKLIINPDMFMPSSELGFLSPSGRCRSFDAAGDGYGRGEGVMALLLKPLETAIADNDPIRAVIRGTRLNQDGRTQGITLPSAHAQQRNMDSLYRQLNIHPNDIQYVEAHGTGTAAGDPLEFSAINAVFDPSTRDHPLVVGSIKSNIGHLEACAALASIIKAIGCLERGTITPQMHFVNPNPNISFVGVKIPVKMMEWPNLADGTRRAAINTFGAGGTNGHCVLEAFQQVASAKRAAERRLLLKVSAEDDSALGKLASKYADYIETQSPDLYDLAYTLLSRRSTLRKSCIFTATNYEEAIENLRAKAPEIYTKASFSVSNVVFLFVGQGAQFPKMGKTLIDHFPVFKAALLECENALASLPDGPHWSIIDELSKAADVSRVQEAEFSQPLCTALQLGLVALWKSFGLRPTVVVGHSSGEIAAAYAAGFISLRDAIIVAYYRGLYLRPYTPDRGLKGGMCAIGMGEDHAKELLERYRGRVQVAAVNSPTSCTLSGDKDAIEEVLETCTREKVFCRRLKVNIAYHSHHMLAVTTMYQKALVNARILPLETEAHCDMFSSVTGGRVNSTDISPVYWKQNMVSTVQFSAAFAECFHDHSENMVVVEIGPHPALKGPAQEIIRGLNVNPVGYFHSCVRGEDDVESLLQSAGAMIAQGVSLNTFNINAHIDSTASGCTSAVGKVLTDLPSYSWNHSMPFWYESRISRNVRFRKFLRHQLLGSRYLDDVPSRPCWRALWMLKEISWLSRTIEDGATAVPPTPFILMALEAATRQVQAQEENNAVSVCLSDLQFKAPLPLGRSHTFDTTLELHLCARQTVNDNLFEFEIFSIATKQPEISTLHCAGKFGWTDVPLQISNQIEWSLTDNKLLEQPASIKPKPLERFHDLRISSDGAAGAFEAVPDQFEDYCISPLILDSLLQVAPASLERKNLPAIYKLLSISKIEVPLEVLSTLSSPGHFTVRNTSTHGFGCQSSIELRLEESSILLTDLSYEVEELVTHPPELKSLFFTPVILPDISRLTSTKGLSLREFLELVTHKWPMCDIGAVGVNSEDINTLLSALERPGERPRFRSIQICGASAASVSERVRLVDKMDTDTKFHIIFVGDQSNPNELQSSLLPNGLVCARGDHQSVETYLSSSFTKVCSIIEISADHWTLWRLKQPTFLPPPNRDATVFVDPDQEISTIKCLPAATYVPLVPSSAGRQSRRKQQIFDAIVIDSLEKSIIVTWTGHELLPWLRKLLESANSVLWVSQQRPTNPYNNIAGNLLRTLQSEQPSIKVTWLVLQGTHPESLMQEAIASAYAGLLKGENEVRLEVTDSQFSILRYLPDDELSASMGLTAPRCVNDGAVNKDYQISLSKREESVIKTYHRDHYQKPDHGIISVKVEASVIDPDDVSAFYGSGSRWCLGGFFAGRVNSNTSQAFPLDSEVVGWCSGTHRSLLHVPMSQIWLCKNGSSAATSAANLAAISTALCAVDGTARARQGDSIRLCVDSILGEAIGKLCKEYGVTVLDSGADGEADYTVERSNLGCVLFNGSPIDVDKYLRSDRGASLVTQLWNEGQMLETPLARFQLADHQKAFKASKTNPYATVLLHNNPEKVPRSIAAYRPLTNIFSNDGAYIIIGGLGGLGRYICTWMVSHGAKDLVTISRNGLTSPEAQQTYNDINASSASLKVLKADACDRAAMTTALARIRKTRAIKGIINMAMLLGDAPLAEMEAWQWDLALRLKIDSSWILHEETLDDPLEFFILFSSIASVLGNRNQAGYNIGNTFLNSLAEYRRSLGRTAISVALGAMADIGVLHALNSPALLQTLTRSGLTPLYKHHLATIIEAALISSHHPHRSLLLTGLEMFDRVDGKLVGSQDQTQLYWTEVPEFGFLQEHGLSGGNENGGKEVGLRERIEGVERVEAGEMVGRAFEGFVRALLGFEGEVGGEMGEWGLDSLSGVSCQYWFYRELGVDVSVKEVLGARSVGELVGVVVERFWERKE
ncbi:hypothetical protein MMC30_003344 [Trapelia coarctata]|nr:hypothetical protein [Trapelia coarctata]